MRVVDLPRVHPEVVEGVFGDIIDAAVGLDTGSHSRDGQGGQHDLQ